MRAPVALVAASSPSGGRGPATSVDTAAAAPSPRGIATATQLSSASTPPASTIGAVQPNSVWARAAAVPGGTRAPGSAVSPNGIRASTASRYTASPPITADSCTAAPVAVASSAIGRRAATRNRRSGLTREPNPNRLAPSRYRVPSRLTAPTAINCCSSRRTVSRGIPLTFAKSSSRTGSNAATWSNSSNALSITPRPSLRGDPGAVVAPLSPVKRSNSDRTTHRSSLCLMLPTTTRGAVVFNARTLTKDPRVEKRQLRAPVMRHGCATSAENPLVGRSPLPAVATAASARRL
jgi:hypothetical protein